jgi:hypothetical protein
LIFILDLSAAGKRGSWRAHAGPPTPRGFLKPCCSPHVQNKSKNLTCKTMLLAWFRHSPCKNACLHGFMFLWAVPDGTASTKLEGKAARCPPPAAQEAVLHRSPRVRARRIYTNASPAGVRGPKNQRKIGPRTPAGVVLVYILGARRVALATVSPGAFAKAVFDHLHRLGQSFHLSGPVDMHILCLRNIASGPEIGLPGRSSAGF